MLVKRVVIFIELNASVGSCDRNELNASVVNHVVHRFELYFI